MNIHMFVASAAAFAAMAGCTTARVGTEPSAAELPTGLTLLDSGRGVCNGAVEIGRQSVRNGSSDLVVREGQNATFQATANDVQWSCLNGVAAQRHRADCPAATTYVRITRGAAEDNFLIECFG